MASAAVTPGTVPLTLAGEQPRFVRVDVKGLQALQVEVNRRKAVNGGPQRPAFRGYYARYKDNGTTPDIEQSEVFVTGLERVCQSIDGKGRLEQAPIREISIIREFVRRAHHYSTSVPEAGHYFEWLALMQHHGAPTRLLDWTYSLHVATHFALTQATRHPGTCLVVWMVDPRWCAAATAEACHRKGITIRGLSSDPMSYKREPDASEELLIGNRLPRCVWPVNPFRLNERLTVQKGVFLAPGDVTATFESNLAALDGHQNELNVTCFTIPPSEIPHVSADLYEANITDTTLFPGLDGFAKSLFLSARHLNLENLSWDSL